MRVPTSSNGLLHAGAACLAACLDRPACCLSLCTTVWLSAWADGGVARTLTLQLQGIRPGNLTLYVGMDSPQSPPASVGDADDPTKTPFKLFVGQVRQATLGHGGSSDRSMPTAPALCAATASTHAGRAAHPPWAAFLHAGRAPTRPGCGAQVPASMTAEQLHPHFEPFGHIEEVSIILDKATQMSRGCGFVTFSTEEAARAAIDALSDQLVLNGKPLIVIASDSL